MQVGNVREAFCLAVVGPVIGGLGRSGVVISVTFSGVMSHVPSRYSFGAMSGWADNVGKSGGTPFH